MKNLNFETTDEKLKEVSWKDFVVNSHGWLCNYMYVNLWIVTVYRELVGFGKVKMCTQQQMIVVFVVSATEMSLL